MRNHLDERALHRAWTENRLKGACVSQFGKSSLAISAPQEVSGVALLSNRGQTRPFTARDASISPYHDLGG
jgi:hypothetical protein